MHGGERGSVTPLLEIAGIRLKVSSFGKGHGFPITYSISFRRFSGVIMKSPLGSFDGNLRADYSVTFWLLASQVLRYDSGSAIRPKNSRLVAPPCFYAT